MEKPANWKPKQDVQHKINEKLKDTLLKQKVEKSINRFNNRKQQGEEKPESTSSVSTKVVDELSDTSAFTAISSNYTRKADSPLKTSWILDSGSDSHICNSTMKDRFITKRAAHKDDTVTSGTCMQIKGYGELRINIVAGNKPGCQGIDRLFQSRGVTNA